MKAMKAELRRRGMQSKESQNCATEPKRKRKERKCKENKRPTVERKERYMSGKNII
jgi:hypothetical protein